MASSFLLRNLSQLATPTGRDAIRGGAMRELHVVDEAAIAVVDGRISFAGQERDLPAEASKLPEIDGEGGTAIPGFVDTHTHIPFAGYRESEFNRRLAGESYESIAASGGGIASTVRATRAATLQELKENVLLRTRLMAVHGTTTCEAKSGYGLDTSNELKQLQALRDAAAESPVRLVPTALPGHEIPAEFRGDDKTKSEYVRLVIDEILPEIVKRKLATFCDVFVERGVFTREEGRAMLQAGSRLGLKSRIHADELSDTGGASLAAELNAASADHLMYVSDEGVAALARSRTVANLLPATSFFLMSERYAPARAFIEQGGIVSLSTDCNPGSSMTESMQSVIQLASLRMKMTVEEALTAATLNGAYSLGLAAETGSLEAGKSADITVLGVPHYLHLVYHFGVNLITNVFSRGNRVVQRAIY